MEHTLNVKIPYNKLAINLNDTQNDTQKTVEEKIIEIIKNNSFVTRDELANLIGVSKATITRAIKASNRIKYVGSSKGGHWEVIE